MKKSKSMILAFALPPTLIFCIASLYPIVRTVLMSFFSVQEISDTVDKWKFNGIGNYIDLLNTPLYRTSWINLSKIFLIGGMATLGISLLLAVILKSGIRGRGFWQAIIYLPNIISGAAMGTVWVQGVFNSSYGILTNLFKALHLDALANIQWLNMENKFWAMLIAFCFCMIGYFMLIWLSGMERISPDYYEAASIDGAGKVRQFFCITLPLLKGILRTNITMWGITVSGFFLWSNVFSPLTPDNATIVPMVYMYNRMFGSEQSSVVTRDAGASAAIGVMLCIFVVSIFTLVNHLLKKDDLEF